MKPVWWRTVAAAVASFSIVPLRAADEGKSGSSAPLLPIANPVMPEDFPDPFLLRSGTWFYAWASNSRTANVPVVRTRDFVTWERLPDALPRLPVWASGETGKTWAPEVAAVKDGFVLYFTTNDQRTGRQAIGAAFSREPGGPFLDQTDKPLICQDKQGGSIDASPFTDADGSRWLLWKNDGNAVRQKTTIWRQGLTADGLGLTGQPAAMVENDSPWEADVIEAPTLIIKANRYYLFYSGGSYTDNTYAIGCATAPALAGPWKKAAANPLLRSTDLFSGPGHQHVFQDDAGQWWLSYHAWEKGKEGYPRGKRTMRLDRLDFDAEGTPHINPAKADQPAPVMHLDRDKK